MQNSAQEFCSFCLKSRNEVDIIDTTKNSLLIDNKCYEFSYIFNDLLQFTSSDECICEVCKDLMVSFYLFKRNIKFPHNHIFRMLIKSQIEEFLNSFADNIEDIRVIRTVNSISLQFDKDEMHQNNVKIESKPDIIEDEQVNEETNDEMGYETLINYHCSKCDKIESTENDSEIHEFLKHSSFGVQLEIEIENSKVYSESSAIEDIFYVCGFCTSHLESFDLLLLHLLNVHNPELLFQINETLNIPSHLIEFATINGYLNYIKECLHHDMTNSIDYEQKKYFFEVYGETDEISNSSEKDIQEEEIEITEMNETMTNYNDTKVKKGKQEKSDELTLTDKEWIRNQISKSKRFVNTDTGERRVVYQCKLSNSCSHISNNAPGFRYHLINKHLKHRRDFEEQGNNDSNEILETFSYITKNSSKNCCNDCSLKFKDQRAYQLHEKCHELFKIVASHSDSIFPSCNTCNQKFLNQDLLHHHLNKHDKNENLLEPIETGDIGAIRQQGKILNNFIQSYGETDLTDYTWKCGHCDNKNFLKEEHCNLHLLLVHTVSFVCPIDKMEFKGFKSVSLFIHHLRNKHSELFPNLSFNCTFCQMEFPTIYDKLNHMKNCDRKNLQCDHCDKRFWKKGDLLAHLKYVTGEIQYKCAVCDKKCISASDLKIHLRSHSKIKPYKCSLCTKSFRTLAARAAHVDAHNSNLMFSCEICKKSFKQRQLYRRHMKAHESR